MKEKLEISYIHTLRALATVAVVLLHIAGDTLYEYKSIDFTTWQTANIMDSLVRFCVPIFIMISGVLLFEKDESYFDFMKKRTKRVLIPFIFWFCVYLSMNILYAFRHSIFDQEITYLDFIKNQLLNGSSFHFWYIYMIIGLYLFIPIISKWIREATKKEMSVYLLLWAGSLLIDGYWQPTSKIDFLYPFLEFNGYMGYAVLGYFLNKYGLFSSTKNELIIGVALFIIGTCLTALLTSHFTSTSGEFEIKFYKYLTLNVCIQAIGIFLLFKNINIKHRIISLLSTYSYGIYLVHVICILIATKLHFESYIPFFLAAKFVMLLFVIGSSLTIIIILHKIPFLKRFAG
jgi:surface polysaccharide O-acyltransferase-like enzyme